MEWLSTSLYAHRGLHDLAKGVPENSRAAFDAAAEAGYGIELDTRLSADGEPVVFHDRTLDALTDNTGPVAALTAEELGRCHLLETAETIPRLQDALQVVAGRAPVLIEIKSHIQSIGLLEQAVRDVIDAYDGPCAILSFNPYSVRWFCKFAAHIPRGRTIIGLISTSGGMPIWRRLLLRSSAAMVRCDPHFYAYDLPALRRGRNRVPVIAWTVRSSHEQGIAQRRANSFIFENMKP